MTDAGALLELGRSRLAHGAGDNRLLPLVAAGKASVRTLATLAAEQQHIIVSDWRAFLSLAARSASPAEGEFFTGLAAGETMVLPMLAAYARGCGLDEAALAAYEPLAGCQAYPSYVSWLAQNAEPIDVVLALTVNFAAWGSYCGQLAASLRTQYGFADEACAFFDFFAMPSPELEQQALATLQAGIDAGRNSDSAFRYGRLLQSYELMFWNTLADAAGE
jgi:hypothetical protein